MNENPEFDGEPFHIPEVEASSLAVKMPGTRPPLILDCRERWEWDLAHIPGSTHIPMSQLPFRLEELDPAQEIVVVCAHGIRSYDVAGFLLQNGYYAQSLRGGLEAWMQVGGEVE